MSEVFYLGAYWKHRQQTMREYLADLKRFFGELREVDPIFSGLFYRSKSLPGFQALILSDLSNLQQLVLQDGDFDSKNYDHADASGRPTLDSNPSINFTTSFWNGKAAIQGGLQIGISAGSSHERLVSSVVAEFPYEEFGDDWLHLGRLYPLFQTVIRVWRPAYATVTSNAFRNSVKTDWKRKATIGWLNYFADASIATDLPPEIECKAPGIGGVILQLTEDRLSAQNADHVALGKEVRDILDARGLLDNERIFSYPRLENAGTRP